MKKGQVTIFIILAIFIVIFSILIFLFFPKIDSALGITPKNPFDKMKECVAPAVENGLEKLSAQGGLMDPELFYEYNGEKLAYLCYTTENYKTCVMQTGILINTFQEELKREVESVSRECLNQLEEEFKRKGYDVKMRSGEVDVEVFPKNIVIKYSNELELTKGEKDVYNGFQISFRSEIYDLLMIATSILEHETFFGDSEISSYMDAYRNLKVEKKKQAEGTKVYMLTNTKNKEKFNFATRSLAWPPGY